MESLSYLAFPEKRSEYRELRAKLKAAKAICRGVPTSLEALIDHEPLGWICVPLHNKSVGNSLVLFKGIRGYRKMEHYVLFTKK